MRRHNSTHCAHAFAATVRWGRGQAETGEGKKVQFSRRQASAPGSADSCVGQCTEQTATGKGRCHATQRPAAETHFDGNASLLIPQGGAAMRTDGMARARSRHDLPDLERAVVWRREHKGKKMKTKRMQTKMKRQIRLKEEGGNQSFFLCPLFHQLGRETGEHSIAQHRSFRTHHKGQFTRWER